MHRPGASESKYWEAMRILTSLQCMDASGIRHALIHNLVDAPGCLFEGESQRVSDSFPNGSLSSLKIYPEPSPKKVVRIKVAKHQVRIGNSRLSPPQAVADRPRLGTRRVRSDFQ